MKLPYLPIFLVPLVARIASGASVLDVPFDTPIVTYETVSNVVNDAMSEIDPGTDEEAVRDIVEGYGYATTSLVQSQVESVSSAVPTTVSNVVSGYGYATKSQVESVSSAVPTTVSNVVSGYGYATTSLVQSQVESISSAVPTTVLNVVYSLPVFSDAADLKSSVSSVGGTAFGLMLADTSVTKVSHDTYALKFSFPACVSDSTDSGWWAGASYKLKWCALTLWIYMDAESYGTFVNATSNNSSAVVPVTVRMRNDDDTSPYAGVVVQKQGYLQHQRSTGFTDPLTYDGTNYMRNGALNISSGEWLWCLCVGTSIGADKHLSLANDSLLPNGGSSMDFYMHIRVVSKFMENDMENPFDYGDSVDELLDLVEGNTDSRTVSVEAYMWLNGNNHTSTGEKGSAADRAQYGMYKNSGDCYALRLGQTTSTLVPGGTLSRALSENMVTNTGLDSVVLKDAQTGDRYRVTVQNGQLAATPVE